MKNDTSDSTIQDCTIQDGTDKNLSLSPLAVMILQDLRSWKQCTVTDLVDSTEAGRSTIKLRLRELVRDGRVQKRGRGKATWYTL